LAAIVVILLVFFLTGCFAGQRVDGTQEVIVMYAQELRYLCADGDGAGCIEHDFGGSVNFSHHLLSIEEDHTIRNQVKLTLKQINIGHGAL
jgi:hypothetical protein